MTSESALNPQTQTSSAWQRLRPIALVFYGGRFFKQLLTNGLPALAPLLAGLAAIDSGRKLWLSVGAVVLASASIGYAALAYLRFRYRIEAHRVLVRSGVLVRENLTVDFSRIQNVSLREPLYARWFGVVIVGVETAGSGGKEITLGGIPREQAEAFREAVATEHRQQTSDGQGAAVASPGEHASLVDISSDDLLRYGLSHNNLVLLALIAGFGSQLIEHRWQEIGGEQLLSWWQTLAGLGLVADIVLVLALLILVAVGLAAFSVGSAFLRFHRYRLKADGETFTRTSGLLTRHSQSLKRYKVQAVVLRQNAVARWFGRVNLLARQASPGRAAQGNQGGAQREQQFLVPALEPTEAQRLLGRFLPDANSEGIHYTRPDRRWIRKTWILSGLLPLTVLLGYAAHLLNPLWLLAWPPAAALGYLVVRQVWSRLGFAVDGNIALFRRGFIGTTVTIFPLARVQRFDIGQSPMQRRKHLCDMRVQLASHALSLPHMPLADAQRLRDLALFHAQTCTSFAL